MESRWPMLVILVLIHQIVLSSGDVGVNYGRVGNNLPPPKKVLDFIASKGIQKVRIFDSDLQVLDAMRGVPVEVVVGVKNEDLANIASSQVNADNWVSAYISPYQNSVLFSCISVGNEVIPGPNAQYVVPAMKNIKRSLLTVGLSDDISVSTAVSTGVLGTSYPPSQGAFTSEVAEIMTQVSNFLYDDDAPLMINVYPYFAYVSDPTINLDFALFNSTTPSFMDEGRAYYNLFDAIVDANYAAMVKVVGKEDVKIMVSETGWPSAGNEPATSIVNAQTYNNNVKNHVLGRGTPRKPGMLLDTFIFALFNENQKTPGVEQNFGSFQSDFTTVYPLW